jgi:hypothetical protein
MKLDAFTHAYVTAALWSSTDDEGEPLDSRYDVSDLAADVLQAMVTDCAAFQAQCGALLTDENCKYRGCDVVEYAGHDFWLTRNGHGAGFWDGEWIEPAASVLDEAARKFGQCDLYVGDDGMIYA